MDIVFVCLCSCICTYVCGCIWRPEVGLGYLLQFVLSHLVFSDSGSHWAWNLLLGYTGHLTPWDLPVSTSCSTEITSDPSLCLGAGYTKINTFSTSSTESRSQPSFHLLSVVCFGFACLFILQAGFICFLSNCYYQGQRSKTVLKAQSLHVSRYQSSLGGIWEISGLKWRSFIRKVSIENMKENQDPASYRVSYL